MVELESLVFRLGHVVRALRRDHPDLSMVDVAPYVGVGMCEVSFSTADPAEFHGASSADEVEAWASRLGLALERHVHDAHGAVWVHVRANGEYQGVQLRVRGSRAMPDAEAAEWRAQQADQAGAEVAP